MTADPQPVAEQTAGIFRKYDHLERLAHPDVADISFGVVHIYPKVDGTNASIWCGEDGTVQCGSRSRVLSAEADNAGFHKWVNGDDDRAIALRAFVMTFRYMTVYGEWLVPHSLKTYREDAWRRFYVFDVYSHITHRYMPFEAHAEPMVKMGIDVIQPLAVIENPSDNQLAGLRDTTNTYLIQDDAGVGEGIVLKNYCPTPDQLVLKADLTWIPCGLLTEGDELLGIEENGQALPSGRAGQRRFCSSIVVKADPGVDEIICITLSDGTRLKTTLGHPWLINRKQGTTEWRNAEDIRPGWKMRRLFSTWGDQVQDYNTGWLSAFYDAEGCITNDDYDFIQVSCSQTKGPVLEELKNRIHKAGFDFYETGGGSSNVRNVVIAGGRREELRFLGLIRPKRLMSKFSPDSMGTIKSPNSENLEVVSVEREGNGPIVQLSTTSRTFIQNGFASHNSWTNKWGRQPWAKIVRNEFKEDHRGVMGMKTTQGEKMVEREIVAEFCTPEFIKKEWWKVVLLVINEDGVDLGEIEDFELFRSQFIEANRHKILPRFLGTTYLTFIDEETRTFIKKFRNPVVDFSKLQKLVIVECKRTMRDFF